MDSIKNEKECNLCENKNVFAKIIGIILKMFFWTSSYQKITS